MAKLEYIWAIGDIHGHAASLRAVLDKISVYPTKKLIFLGDYIDRGPEPKEVIDIILSLKYEKVTLMGEHEMLLLHAIRKDIPDPKLVLEWSKYGYETTLRAFNAADVESLKEQLTSEYLNFFNSLQLFHTESFVSGKKELNLLFSHAGPFLDFPLEEQLHLKNIVDHDRFLQEKNLDVLSSCLFNADKYLQKSLSTWDNYLLVHGHLRTQYRQNRNRLQYSGKDKHFNFDFSDVPNPLYFPGGSAVAALDIDTGVDVGGKLSAIGFAYDNIDFGKGKIIIKVIQADSSRRSRNINAVVFDLSLPFTDEVNWFTRIINKLFKKKRHKKYSPPKDVKKH